MKKTLSLLTALLLACTGMTACGEKEDSSTENTNESSVTVTEENSEAETEEITEADTTEVTTTEEVTTEAKTCPLSEMTIDEFESRFNELIPPLFEEEFTARNMDPSGLYLTNREYENLGEYGTACTYLLCDNSLKLYVFESEDGAGIREVSFNIWDGIRASDKYKSILNNYKLPEQIVTSIFMLTNDINSLSELEEFNNDIFDSILKFGTGSDYNYIKDSIGYYISGGIVGPWARIIVNPQ